jgi:hypothetical protein
MCYATWIFSKFSNNKPLEDQFRVQTERKIVTHLKLALFINAFEGGNKSSHYQSHANTVAGFPSIPLRNISLFKKIRRHKYLCYY